MREGCRVRCSELGLSRERGSIPKEVAWDEEDQGKPITGR
jgi:hypothetical protein